MDKIGLEGVGSRRRKGSESAAEISRMGIRAEVGWSIWRVQVTGLAERILLRISMEDELARITRIKRITVLPQMALMDTDVRVRRD